MQEACIMGILEGGSLEGGSPKGGCQDGGGCLEQPQGGGKVPNFNNSSK